MTGSRLTTLQDTVGFSPRIWSGYVFVMISASIILEYLASFLLEYGHQLPIEMLNVTFNYFPQILRSPKLTSVVVRGHDVPF